MIEKSEAEECDVLVIGSGSAGLAALRSAVAGLRVTILEKSGLLGGTSAMSGAGTWVPANHHAAEVGLEDSPAEARISPPRRPDGNRTKAISGQPLPRTRP